MLGIIAVVLIFLWLLGFFAFHVTTAFVHVALICGPSITRAAFHERQNSKRVERRSTQPANSHAVADSQPGPYSSVAFSSGLDGFLRFPDGYPDRAITQKIRKAVHDDMNRSTYVCCDTVHAKLIDRCQKQA